MIIKESTVEFIDQVGNTYSTTVSEPTMKSFIDKIEYVSYDNRTNSVKFIDSRGGMIFDVYIGSYMNNVQNMIKAIFTGGDNDGILSKYVEFNRDYRHIIIAVVSIIFAEIIV